MPLQETDLDQKFILVSPEQTVGKALELLNVAQGKDDWHFIVAWSATSYGALGVKQLDLLLEKLGSALFELPFKQLRPHIPVVRTAQMEAIGIGIAEEWALADPLYILVVLRGDEVVGRLFMGEERGASGGGHGQTGAISRSNYQTYQDIPVDARAQWNPADIVPPICPACSHQGYFGFESSDSTLYCVQCGIQIGIKGTRAFTAPPEDETSALETLEFSAYWTPTLETKIWKTMWVYLFRGDRGAAGVQADFDQRRKQPAHAYRTSTGIATQQLRMGAQITIRPEIPGVRFNPPFANVLWIEDWHLVEFRMQGLLDPAFQGVGTRLGRIAFYVGPLLIGEVNLYVQVIQGNSEMPASAPVFSEQESKTAGTAYQAIFVSYSHRDASIVDQLQKAYIALGNTYLRDVDILRSGEAWNPALLTKIEEADIFQLIWSKTAKESIYVEQEWRFALDLNREQFIRPTYCQKPMPSPPEELRDLHFSYFDLSSMRSSLQGE